MVIVLITRIGFFPNGRTLLYTHLTNLCTANPMMASTAGASYFLEIVASGIGFAYHWVSVRHWFLAQPFRWVIYRLGIEVDAVST